MKEDNQNKTYRKNYSGLLKGLIIGPLVGAFLGFLLILLMSGNLPFAETDTFGLGDMSGIIAIFYLYSIMGGGCFGLYYRSNYWCYG
jgi:integral membrane sensor domain MASE1